MTDPKLPVLPDGVKPPPDGYDFIQGPLPHPDPVGSNDILWLMQDRQWWVTGHHGCDTLLYAIRRGTELHRLNFGAPLAAGEHGTDLLAGLRDAEYAHPYPPAPFARLGDAVAAVFEQLIAGNWVDDHGHDVRKNVAMIALREQAEAAIDHIEEVRRKGPQTAPPREWECAVKGGSLVDWPHARPHKDKGWELIRVREVPAQVAGGDIRDEIRRCLLDTYACTRVWEAWQVGTMDQDDFHPAWEDEEILSSLEQAFKDAIERELSAARAEAEGLRKLLGKLAGAIEQVGYETGVCCCGGDVSKHTIGDGHSPVDQGTYYMEPILMEAKAAALKAGEGQGQS